MKVITNTTFPEHMFGALLFNCYSRTYCRPNLYVIQALSIFWNENLSIRCFRFLNSLTHVCNAPFLYPLKTSENLEVFWCFQGVEKGCIENKWVKFAWLLFWSIQYVIDLLTSLLGLYIHPNTLVNFWYVKMW